MAVSTSAAPLVFVLVALSCLSAVYCEFTIASVGSFLIQNAGIVGVQVPSYLKVMTYQKSTILTKILHFFVGSYLETYFGYVLKRIKMPNSAPVASLENKAQGIYLKDGEVRGMNSLKIADHTEADVAFDKGLPAVVITTTFTNMSIFYRYKMDMGLEIIKTGEAKSNVSVNTLILKFRPTLDITEFCFVRLYDIEFAEFGGFKFTAKSTDAFSISGGTITATLMDTFFQTAGSAVQTLIENIIAKILFYEIPKQSSHICDNPEGSYVEKKKPS